MWKTIHSTLKIEKEKRYGGVIFCRRLLMWCYFIQTVAHKERTLRPAPAHDRCRYFIYVSARVLC